MNPACLYCRGSGVHGDEFTGGESYCACSSGDAIKAAELAQVAMPVPVPAHYDVETLKQALVRTERERDDSYVRHREDLQRLRSVTADLKAERDLREQVNHLAVEALQRADAAEAKLEDIMARVEEAVGATVADCPLTHEAALAALDAATEQRTAAEASAQAAEKRCGEIVIALEAIAEDNCHVSPTSTGCSTCPPCRAKAALAAKESG